MRESLQKRLYFLIIDRSSDPESRIVDGRIKEKKDTVFRKRVRLTLLIYDFILT